ncbi:MAG: class B sortase [Acutalibacteraceae bacterium]
MIDIIRKIIRGLAFIVLMVSLWIIVKIVFIDYYKESKLAEEAQQIYYDDHNDEEQSQQERFADLIKINPDIKAWINISNTRINYPVVQAPENDRNYYLTHNYKKEYSQYGSIFIDSVCSAGTDSKNIILHGHHMRNGEMFANILKFSDVEFCKENPIINFDTLNETRKYKVISIFKTNTLPEQGEIFNYQISSFGKGKFMEFVEDVKKRSLVYFPVDVNESDQLLTLSTCSYEFKDFRTVVVARKVRKEESDYVDVSLIKTAPNPLWPDCWYREQGRSAP